MWMATPDHGLAATMYGPCTVTTAVQESPVTINVDTAYPFEDLIRMTINPTHSIRFPLYLRIPNWCSKATVEISGKPIEAVPDKNGFVKLERTWSAGDKVSLSLPMNVRISNGRENSFPDGYFTRNLARNKNISNPYATVHYGPLLFALPIPDKGPNAALAGIDWNFALDIDTCQTHEQISIIHKAMPKKWSWELEAPLQLSVPTRQFDWNPIAEQPLPLGPVDGGKRHNAILVPYNCTKFRISMFPVTIKTLGQVDTTPAKN
jgi:hypothetical protein